MPSRELPARPDLDHLRHEAKALRRAFREDEPAAVERVHTVLGPRSALKLTEAQRVVAREYGFTTWARLRTHVQAARGIDDAVSAFLKAIANRDVARALSVLDGQPRIVAASPHVAAVLGLDDEVRRQIADDPARVHLRAGAPAGDPLLWLCHSPFHGESAARDAGLERTLRTLLAAGADPNTRDSVYGVPALYALTGVNDAPRSARILLDAGARPDDGESVFHAAERFHVASLELLLEYGADINFIGDWGNTPLYFLLRYHDVEREPRVRQGLLWLLDHGADPNVRCGRQEQETSLHVAARRGQHPAIVRLLLVHGADVHATRGDGRSAWTLAMRSGFPALAQLLEGAGAEPAVLTPEDLLMVACGRGDADAARGLASSEVVASLGVTDLRLLPEAAASGRTAVAFACLAAGFPVDVDDENGATALHHAAIHGRADLARELLARGADHRIRDGQHRSTPLGWACFGADWVADPDGAYAETVTVLLSAGAQPAAGDHDVAHAGVREVIRAFVAEAN